MFGSFCQTKRRVVRLTLPIHHTTINEKMQLCVPCKKKLHTKPEYDIIATKLIFII